MRFSEDFIRRVTDANNLVDLISQYTQLKSSGGGLMGRCPFPDHVEKTPSFSVSEAKQVYHCFGCHKSGNIISFLKDYNGYSFPEAVEWLANRASIPLPVKENAPAEDLVAKRRKQLMEANQVAMKFFVAELKAAPPDHYVQKYIQKRGLTAETLETFNIGFAPKEWDGLVTHLQGKNISAGVAEEARLVVARKEGRAGHFDMFRDRLMFPIQAPMGDAVAFGGRVLNPEDNPKYLNSPETPVFEKKKVLYGLHQTARYIRSEDKAVIVEGYMDAVSLYQAGIKNVAAVMSSSLTHDQARLLKRMTRDVIMLLDGDDAGIDGAERSLPILLAADLHPKGVFLPDDMDPDDFVKTHGVEALQTLLGRAQELLFAVMDRWMRGYKGDPTEKLKLVDKVKPILRGIPDSRLRELYIQEIAKRLGVQSVWLRESLAGGQNSQETRGFPGAVRVAANPAVTPIVSQIQGPAAEEEVQVVSLKNAPAAELTALALTLKSRANFNIFASEFSLENLTHEGVKTIFQEATRAYGQNPERFDRLTSLLITKVDEPSLLFQRDPGGPKTDEMPDDEKAEMDAKLLRGALRRVTELRLRRDLKELQQELVTNPSADKVERLTDLQKRLSSLNKG